MAAGSTGDRSDPEPPHAWAGVIGVTGVRDRGYPVVRGPLARYAVGEPLRNVIGTRGY